MNIENGPFIGPVFFTLLDVAIVGKLAFHKAAQEA
jgi:hypothetical protein